MGATHSTKADTLNRLTLVEHNNDGTHTGLGAGMSLLEAASPSGVASVDFTSLISSAYKTYMVVCSGLLPATDGANLLLRMSDDGGSTFEADGGDYIYAAQAWTDQAAADNTDVQVSDSDDKIQLHGLSGVGNLSSEGISSVIHIFDPASTVHHTAVKFSSVHLGINGEIRTSDGGGSFRAVAAADGFQIKFSTGNIASGEIALYGLRVS